MASRVRTLNDAKAVASNNFELYWWVFMRVSGLLLVFLVLGHIYMQNIAINSAEINYDYVVGRFSNPTWKIYDIFLLGLTMLHGANGLRYVLDDCIKNLRVRFWVKIIIFTIIAAIFVIGSITLWSFSFQEMGDAVRGVASH